MNKIKSILFSFIVLLIMTATPAMAGVVTLMNLSESNAYYVQYESWIFGFKYWAGLCANPGKTETNNNLIGSIGVIEVYPSGKNCSSTTYNPSGKLKSYTPPGAYLPHRSFKVIAQTNDEIVIRE